MCGKLNMKQYVYYKKVSKKVDIISPNGGRFQYVLRFARTFKLLTNVGVKTMKILDRFTDER